MPVLVRTGAAERSLHSGVRGQLPLPVRNPQPSDTEPETWERQAGGGGGRAVEAQGQGRWGCRQLLTPPQCAH